MTLEHKAKAVQAIVAALADAVRDLVDALTVPVTDKRLFVPWIGQNTDRTDDDYSLNDCGAAAVAMVINCYRGDNGVTVDEVSIATGKPRGYASLSFNDLIKAAARYNVRLQHASLTLAEICSEIERGNPVIVLVDYKSMPLYNRFSATYDGGHYLVVVGYEGVVILYHDPYWLAQDRGAYRSMTREDFTRAYTTAAPGNQYASHALRILS